MLYAIASFLFNGESIRYDILDSMLEKLYDIRDCVKHVFSIQLFEILELPIVDLEILVI